VLIERFRAGESSNHARFIGSVTDAPVHALVVCSFVTGAIVLPGVNLPMSCPRLPISAAIGEPFNAPRSAVMDERYQVAISMTRNRCVAGIAELGRSRHKKICISAFLYKVRCRIGFLGQHG
jgi:D-amino-acid dehydrogenase